MPTVRPEPEEMDGEREPGGTAADEGPAAVAPPPKPSRPGVILEDIDALEQRYAGFLLAMREEAK